MAGRREVIKRDRQRRSLARTRRVKEILARQARMAETLRALEARLKAESEATA